MVGVAGVAVEEMERLRESVGDLSNVAASSPANECSTLSAQYLPNVRETRRA